MPGIEPTLHLIEFVNEPDPALLRALSSTGHRVSHHVCDRDRRSLPIGDRADTFVLNVIDTSGLACCRDLRARHPQASICVVHRGLSEWDETIALELGADVVIRRPTKLRRLMAQVRALTRRDRLRRPRPARLRLNSGARSVVVDGRAVQLTDAEFDLVSLLAECPGRVVTRDTIYARLRGLTYDGSDRAIDLRISRIRNKLGDNAHRPAFIRSVRGEGYMLMVDDL